MALDIMVDTASFMADTTLLLDIRVTGEERRGLLSQSQLLNLTLRLILTTPMDTVTDTGTDMDMDTGATTAATLATTVGILATTAATSPTATRTGARSRRSSSCTPDYNSPATITSDHRASVCQTGGSLWDRVEGLLLIG